MLRGRKLRPIAILSEAAVEVPGVGSIPTVLDALPEVPVAPIYFGVFVPGDVPEEVSGKMQAAWASLEQSETLAEYTQARGSLMTIHSGEEAQDKVWPSIMLNAWLLHDNGQSATSPEVLGIPRP